jgi:HTH-type transcriptional regulator / antitoxin HipB
MSKIPLQSVKQIGTSVRETRKRLRMTQNELALVSGVGLRFIHDLERGKPTIRLEPTLRVLAALGIQLEVVPPGVGIHDGES